MKLSQKSIDFIKNNVLTELGFEAITNDNLQEIVNYIADYYEIPLAQAKENGELIDENLLELSAYVITEITTNPEW
ncbi:MAG: hypothetical protein IKC48_01200 [Clostridia bacterium]|nr:hypothetical protein [Clostridia bacterium]